MTYDSNALTKTALLGTAGMTVLAILSKIPCIGVIFGCVMFFAYIAVGVSYGRFLKEKGIPVEMIPTAVYGGIAAAIASLIPNLITASVGDEFFLIKGISIGFAIIFGAAWAFILGAAGGGFYGLYVE